MAMFEKEGFCPEDLLHVHARESPNILTARTLTILGDRSGYMVYAKETKGDEVYLLDMLFAEDSTLGFEVACTLQDFIPECKYAVTGKKIQIYDLTDEKQVPEECIRHEDDNYLVGICQSNEVVNMFICKRQPF